MDGGESYLQARDESALGCTTQQPEPSVAIGSDARQTLPGRPVDGEPVVDGVVGGGHRRAGLDTFRHLISATSW